jgi:uncharacterized FlaG/YvyC family protein
MHIESIGPLTGDDLLAIPAVRRTTPQSNHDAGDSPQPSGINVEKVMGDLDRAMQPFDIALKFSKDEDTGTIVIQMIDQSTGETLQQIPNEAMLRVAAILGRMQGRIFNCKA